MNLRNKSRAPLTLMVLLFCCGRAAAADSRAQTGPVQVTLRVHNTAVKLLDSAETSLDTEGLLKGTPLKGKNNDEVDWNKIDEKGMDQLLKGHERANRTKINEPIWIQIEVKNVGRSPLIVNDPLFDTRGDFGTELKTNASRSRGTYAEVVGPDGKRVDWTAPPVTFDGCEPPGPRARPLSGADQQRVDSILKTGRAEGLSTAEVQKRLDDFSTEKSGRDRASTAERRRKRLEPGESVTTPGWIYGGVCGDRKPPAAPVAGYAELWGFKLTKPGHYRIRAVYDERPPRSWSKSRRGQYLKEAPGSVRAATPEIILEVKP